jgi:5,10-methylenetetrahydrofolate reductase
MADANTVNLNETAKRVALVCDIDVDTIELKKMGPDFGDRDIRVYVMTVPSGTHVSQRAIADVIIHSSIFPTDPHIRCIGINIRKPDPR